MSLDVQKQILDLVFKEDELSWQDMLLALVEQEGMDPWDIDISVLSRSFADTLLKMKETNLRITGKVVLAAALLLKMKSERLMDEDLNALDQLINGEVYVEELDDLFHEMVPFEANKHEHIPKVVPKTPQPRKRKISVYDLVNALEKALDVEERRKTFEEVPEFKAPEKKRELSEVMEDIFAKVTHHYKKQAKKPKTLTFSQLVPSENKEDKVLTFVPLLHLENARKVNMNQEEHFGEIDVLMQNI
jgi:segregation and condensation protein A